MRSLNHRQKRSIKTQSTPLPPVLRLFWLFSVLAIGLTFLVAWIESRHNAPRNTWHPLAEPLLSDLLEYLSTFRLLHTAAFFRNPLYPAVAYPPFGAILFALLYRTSHPAFAYLAVAFTALSIVLFRITRKLQQNGISHLTAIALPLTIALTSFPIAGMLQRGNLELFVWIFAASGAWAFLHDRNDAAAVLWGLAAAIKLYPILLLVLLIPRHKIHAVALGIFSFATTSVLSMAYLGPTLSIAWKGSLHNVFSYQSLRAAEWSLHELATNHSVFGHVRVVAVLLGHNASAHTLAYYATGAAIFLIAFLARLRALPPANQLLAVTTFMLMLPTVSYFYTLVHLYTPWLVLVFLAIRAKKAGLSMPGLPTTLFIFLPLFAPYTLFTFRNWLLFGGLVQATCLACLFACSLRYPFQFPLADPLRLNQPQRPASAGGSGAGVSSRGSIAARVAVL